MNKLELISELNRTNGLSKAQAQKVVELFFDAMTQALAAGQRVEIRGLCTFQIRTYPGYIGRNPKSGKPVQVAEKRLPYFKPGTDLKRRVDT